MLGQKDINVDVVHNFKEDDTRREEDEEDVELHKISNSRRKLGVALAQEKNKRRSTEFIGRSPKMTQSSANFVEIRDITNKTPPKFHNNTSTASRKSPTNEGSVGRKISVPKQVSTAKNS